MADPAPDPGSLQNLRDIVVPEAVPWWPPAPGWYVVGAVLVILLLWLGIRWARHYRADRYRRAALSELSRIERNAQSSQDPWGALAEVSELLKRVALAAFPREAVAELSGDVWWNFLGEVGDGTTFAPETQRLMETALFARAEDCEPSEGEVEEVLATARRWIRSHGPLPAG
jgi:hypothetical protein